VDAFAGKFLDKPALVRMCAEMGMAFEDSFVQKDRVHDVHARLLRNLLNIYHKKRDLTRLMGVCMQASLVSSGAEQQNMTNLIEQLTPELGRIPLDHTNGECQESN